METEPRSAIFYTEGQHIYLATNCNLKKYNGEELHYDEKSGVVLFVHDGNIFIH